MTLIFSSDCIKQHAEELEQRPQNDENVKYGVHPLPALAQSVQNGADRVGNTAQQQKQEAREGQRLHRLPSEEDDRPAHALSLIHI